jgi:hypothetical protein
MLTYNFGLQVMHLDIFCIEPGTLRFSPEELQRDPTFAIVHSVKKYQDMKEQDIRAFFRRARERSGPMRV